MPPSTRPVRLNHFNVVLENFDAGVRHFQDVFGAEFQLDLPRQDMHAGLIEFAGVMIEIFVPHAFILNARYGPHYLGVEYQADMPAVREAIDFHGLRIARDLDTALHTHPKDGFGVAFEFYGNDFLNRSWPLLGGPTKPLDFWRNEHPLGLTGASFYTIAVHDLEAASGFLHRFLDARRVGENEAQPEWNARRLDLLIAGGQVEVVSPSGEGAVSRHIAAHGEGIRSIAFGVADLSAALAYFQGRGIALDTEQRTGFLTLPACHNLGLLFEFYQDV